ncbi:hypothetical protein N7495_003182 [Penicillium taxi]|uniref:uncharacterized protein n=1 Tax=Penicillium taxi TaxID=168475 RepID=UPI0025457EBB|nr:uncharacterized protein N7495_003182 [Penicillium taxi]KAJ5902654.1 hypothetical protein N7495_003182 [Penicillium taxi]
MSIDLALLYKIETWVDRKALGLIARTKYGVEVASIPRAVNKAYLQGIGRVGLREPYSSDSSHAQGTWLIISRGSRQLPDTPWRCHEDGASSGRVGRWRSGFQRYGTKELASQNKGLGIARLRSIKRRQVKDVPVVKAVCMTAYTLSPYFKHGLDTLAVDGLLDEDAVVGGWAAALKKKHGVIM